MGDAGYQKHYGGMKMMIEGETSSEDSDSEWERTIVPLSTTAQMKFKGKTLGSHRVTVFDIAQAMYATQTTSGDAITMGARYSEMYGGKKTALIRDLKLIFGNDKVDEIVAELSGFKEGAVILIPKDENTWLTTRMERYRNIDKAMSFADGGANTRTNKMALENSFTKKTPVKCATEEMARWMMKRLREIGTMENKGGQSYFTFLGWENIRSGDWDMNRSQLHDLLRWNSWLHFEKAVAEQTTEENPTEWDSLVGKVWRMKCGKDHRFEE